MILHWLTGFSVQHLIELGVGIIVILVVFIRFVIEQDQPNPMPLRIMLLGLAVGICFLGTAILRNSKRWYALGDITSLLGTGLMALCVYQRSKHRREKGDAKSSLPEPTVPSDKIWPPPPTSPR